MFENLDFAKLKLPIEPQNLIYIYIAYKLINSLDKLDLSRLGSSVRIPASNPLMVSSITKQSQNFMFFIFLIIGAAFLILNNILNRISFSSISVENLSAQDPIKRLKNVAKGCPLRKCPLFTDVDITSCLNQCPMKMKQCPMKMKKCPMKMNMKMKQCPMKKEECVPDEKPLDTEPESVDKTA